MNKIYRSRLVALMLIAGSCILDASAQTSTRKGTAAERSAIRVLCEGKSLDAMVSINGVQKGNCPLDLEVVPGLIKIRAVKKRDEFYDSVFAQEFTLGSGAARRVEVVFNMRRQFRADAVARVDKEVEASQRALEVQRRGEMAALEASAAGGDAAAMARLGLFYKRGLAGPVDMKKAVDWYRRGAEGGDATAMFEYARQLEWGSVVAKDKATAVAFYKKSAAMGNAAALNRVGHLVQQGSDGFQKDIKLAGAYYKKAAEGGNSFSSTMWWGTLPESEQDAGLAVQEALDKIYARIQVEKARTGEDYEEMEGAASIYANGGYGYAEDPARALEYYRMAWRQMSKAAAVGDRDAIYALGYRSEIGMGMPADRGAAIRYYKKAQQLGDANAAEALNKMQSE
jgi:TPR repeat protein